MDEKAVSSIPMECVAVSFCIYPDRRNIRAGVQHGRIYLQGILENEKQNNKNAILPSVFFASSGKLSFCDELISKCK